MDPGLLPKLELTRDELPNGLQVVLCPDRRAPLAHLSVHYRVGASHEEPGLSGLAHLFEHLMFEGSANVGRNEHGRRVDEAGGRWNASTSKDRTNYHQTLPSHQIELALWLESDRMAGLRLTRETLENQRRTVIEEKKQSYDNRPYGPATLRFDELAYSNWAYAHPVIGYVEDLERVSLNDLESFHRRFYGPSNAVLALSGDFAPRQAESLIHKYFAPLTGEPPPAPPSLDEPVPSGPRVEEITDHLAILPAVSLGFQMPPLGSPEHPPLAMLAGILGEGASSRLFQRFVYDLPWMTGLWAGPNRYRGPQQFRIWFQVQAGVDPARVLTGVEQELARVRDERVTPNELDKARNQAMHHFVNRLARTSQVGEMLAQGASVQGDPEAAHQELLRSFDVTADQIRDAAAEFLVPERCTRLVVRPGRPS